MEEVLQKSCSQITRGCGLTKVEPESGGFYGVYFWYEGWGQPPVGAGYWSDVGGEGPFATRQLACAEIETSCNTCGRSGPRCAQVPGGLPENGPFPLEATPPEAGCACEVGEDGLARVSLECFCSVHDCPSLAEATNACLLRSPVGVNGSSRGPGHVVQIEQRCDRIEVRSSGASWTYDAESGELRSATAERFGVPIAPCGAVRVEAGTPANASCDTTRSCSCGSWTEEPACSSQLWVPLSSGS